MKKIFTFVTGVVIACALSGCVSDQLKIQQEKERAALLQKQWADGQTELAKKALDASAALTLDATHNLEQAKQKQAQTDADLQSILCPVPRFSL